ncbi:MAG: hypothetical protein GVY02_06965 [Bacteroidetes bacterium]|jgi:methylmalonyl-CoA mutase|nr:hypothetical protein [Bacteroidota bacterium]
MKSERKDPFQQMLNFPPVSKSEWVDLIERDLKGADYKQKLNWRTGEGFSILPFFTREDLGSVEHDTSGPVVNDAKWGSLEPVHAADPSEANRHIKKLRQEGIRSFYLRSEASGVSGALGGDMEGTQIHEPSDLKKLLKEVDHDTDFLFNSGMSSPGLLAMLMNHDNEIKASFIFDPFRFIAERGKWPLPLERFKKLLSELSDLNGYRTLCADVLFYHHCGATIVQELGLMLATASEYFAHSENAEATSSSFFTQMSAGPLYFPEIAKFRAARLLWPRLLKAYGLDESTPLHIVAETTPTNKTITDTYNNLLRTNTEAMSAVIGGADQVLIHPYNKLIKKDDPFALRLARNMHRILREESHFEKVDDPSAGSYYLEQLTDTVAKEAWKFFQTIENSGGLLKALEGGMIREQIQQSAQEKQHAYNKGKRVLVGTNDHANPKEELPENVNPDWIKDSLKLTDFEPQIDSDSPILDQAIDAFQEGATIGDIVPLFHEPQKVLYQTVEPVRFGEVFDRMQLKARRFASENGSMPVIYLVPVGDPKWRNLRATYSQNILGCTGFNIHQSIGYDSIDEASEAIEPADHSIFVLCGSDKEYGDLVEPFCNAFSEKGICILAGYPGDKEESYRQAGIDYFIHTGMNIAERLQQIQNHIFDETQKS